MKDVNHRGAKARSDGEHKDTEEPRTGQHTGDACASESRRELCTVAAQMLHLAVSTSAYSEGEILATRSVAIRPSSKGVQGMILIDDVKRLLDEAEIIEMFGCLINERGTINDDTFC